MTKFLLSLCIASVCLAQTDINKIKVIPSPNGSAVGEVDFRNKANTHQVGIAAPDTLSADHTFRLPATDTTGGGFVVTDGAYNLNVTPVTGIAMPTVLQTAGCDPTGATDSSACLNAAFAAAAGGGIRVPSSGFGFYAVAGPVTIPAHTYVLCDVGTTVFKRTGSITSGSGWFDIPDATGVAIDGCTFEGQVTTPVGFDRALLTSPVTTTFTDNSTIWVHGGKNFKFVNNVIQHTGGYALILDASINNILNVTINGNHFQDNRPFLFGTGGDLTYGAWQGGILNYSAGGSFISRLTITDNFFDRIAGHGVFWYAVNGNSTPNRNIIESRNHFKVIGLDGIIDSGINGLTQDGNVFESIGFVSTSDADLTGTPKWFNACLPNGITVSPCSSGFAPASIPGVAIDTASLVINATRTGNTITLVNGGSIDADGLGYSVVSGNRAYNPLPSDPDYNGTVASQMGPAIGPGISSTGQNYAYGISTGNSNNTAQGASNLTITNNSTHGLGGGGIRVYGGRNVYVMGNEIVAASNSNTTTDHNFYSLITVGNIGTGPNQRAQGVTVTKNKLVYGGSSGIVAVAEDAQYGAFASTDKNEVFNNDLIGPLAQFLKDTNSISIEYGDNSTSNAGVTSAGHNLGISQHGSTAVATFRDQMELGTGVALDRWYYGTTPTTTTDLILTLSSNGRTYLGNGSTTGGLYWGASPLIDEFQDSYFHSLSLAGHLAFDNARNLYSNSNTDIITNLLTRDSSRNFFGNSLSVGGPLVSNTAAGLAIANDRTAYLAQEFIGTNGASPLKAIDASNNHTANSYYSGSSITGATQFAVSATTGTGCSSGVPCVHLGNISNLIQSNAASTVSFAAPVGFGGTINASGLGTASGAVSGLCLDSGGYIRVGGTCGSGGGVTGTGTTGTIPIWTSSTVLGDSHLSTTGTYGIELNNGTGNAGVIESTGGFYTNQPGTAFNAPSGTINGANGSFSGVLGVLGNTTSGQYWIKGPAATAATQLTTVDTITSGCTSLAPCYNLGNIRTLTVGAGASSFSGSLGIGGALSVSGTINASALGTGSGVVNAICLDSSNFLRVGGTCNSTGSLTGTGTTGKIPIWTSSTALGDSILSTTGTYGLEWNNGTGNGGVIESTGGFYTNQPGTAFNAPSGTINGANGAFSGVLNVTGNTTSGQYWIKGATATAATQLTTVDTTTSGCTSAAPCYNFGNIRTLTVGAGASSFGGSLGVGGALSVSGTITATALGTASGAVSNICLDSSNVIRAGGTCNTSGTVTGSGTTGRIPVWSSSTGLGDSNLSTTGTYGIELNNGTGNAGVIESTGGFFTGQTGTAFNAPSGTINGANGSFSGVLNVTGNTTSGQYWIKGATATAATQLTTVDTTSGGCTSAAPCYNLGNIRTLTVGAGASSFSGSVGVGGALSVSGTITATALGTASGAVSNICLDSSNIIRAGGTCNSSGSVGGSGTVGTIPIWSTSSTLGSSNLSDSGSLITSVVPLTVKDSSNSGIEIRGGASAASILRLSTEDTLSTNRNWTLVNRWSGRGILEGRVSTLQGGDPNGAGFQAFAWDSSGNMTQDFNLTIGSSGTGKLMIGSSSLVAIDNSNQHTGSAYYAGSSINGATQFVATATSGTGCTVLAPCVNLGNIGNFIQSNSASSVSFAAPTSFGNLINVAGSFRSTAFVLPSSGEGLEVVYQPSSHSGFVLGFNRTSNTYQNMSVDGSTLTLQGLSQGNVGICSAPVTYGLELNCGTGTGNSGVMYAKTGFYTDSSSANAFNAPNGTMTAKFASFSGTAQNSLNVPSGGGAFGGVAFLGNANTDIDAGNKLELVGQSGVVGGNVYFVVKNDVGLRSYMGMTGGFGGGAFFGSFDSLSLGIRTANADRITISAGGTINTLGILNAQSGVVSWQGSQATGFNIGTNTGAFQFAGGTAVNVQITNSCGALVAPCYKVGASVFQFADFRGGIMTSLHN